MMLYRACPVFGTETIFNYILNQTDYCYALANSSGYMILNFSASAAKESLIYSYGRSFNGFAAKLSDEVVVRLSGGIFR